ncbi:Vitamin B12 ABC transporter, ATPase component BtuD [Rhodovulum sp. PH10]|uniref:ABC transporter ATP-binding protein n=1 Tax=Rhodovulum sp. PH10 TaxID=1187851 RepID=UPI00027C2AD8|nr:ABC transporter ATP-binding protein [Rhodovulum sp. PH10]EJW12852.1 Vitamin B12 ABC transporter, ATPase component BtuD [Rhodovulum sp. PH10]
MSTAAPYLVAEKVGVALGRREVLADVSLSLERKSLVALVGPNGAGKTTLLRALAGLVPASGTVFADGEAVAALSVKERARRFAYLPQGHAVHWPLPVRDVVALGRFPHGATDPSRLGPADLAAVERAIAATDLKTLADRRITELSGGERARVALARVLAVEAPVILADEPVAALDPHYQLEVTGLLHAAAANGALVIVVTHDLGLAARFADKVLVLADGRLVLHGPPAEALAPEILASVFRIAAFHGGHDGQPVVVPWSAT